MVVQDVVIGNNAMVHTTSGMIQAKKNPGLTSFFFHCPDDGKS
jgi:hypothetical protein